MQRFTRSQCGFGVRAASYTWAGAQNFFDFTIGSGRGAQVISASSLTLGDVIHLRSSGVIYHSMIITGFSNTDPLLSYHNNDTYNKKLSTILSGLGPGTSAVYAKMA